MIMIFKAATTEDKLSTGLLSTGLCVTVQVPDPWSWLLTGVLRASLRGLASLPPGPAAGVQAWWGSYLQGRILWLSTLGCG